MFASREGSGESVHMRYAPTQLIVNTHAAVQVFGQTRSLNVDLSLYLHPYFVFASREGSGGSVHMHRLARAIDAH